MTDDAPLYELVYDAEAWPFIEQTWPQAVYSDASDSIHEGRFEVRIAGVTADEFYPQMLREGWAGACLGFEMHMRIPEHKEKVLGWITAAKRMDA